MTTETPVDPHREVYEWFLAKGPEARHAEPGLNSAYEHAVAHGKVKKGIAPDSAEHAAAQAGLAVWQVNHSVAKKKRGEGQGRQRRTKGGATDVAHNSAHPAEPATDPHRGVYEWFMAKAPGAQHAEPSLNLAYEHAVAHGKVKKGIAMESAEHAAARAGLAVWRANHPTPNKKGGAGRGQGRRAEDGATDLVHKTVNIRRDQETVLKNLGGSKWLRAILDEHQNSESASATANQG